MTTLVWFLIGLISGAVFMHIGLMAANAVRDNAEYKTEIRKVMERAMEEALEQYKTMTSQTLAQYILKNNSNGSDEGDSPTFQGDLGDPDDGSWKGR